MDGDDQFVNHAMLQKGTTSLGSNLKTLKAEPPTDAKSRPQTVPVTTCGRVTRPPKVEGTALTLASAGGMVIFHLAWSCDHARAKVSNELCGRGSVAVSKVAPARERGEKDWRPFADKNAAKHKGNNALTRKTLLTNEIITAGLVWPPAAPENEDRRGLTVSLLNLL